MSQKKKTTYKKPQPKQIEKSKRLTEEVSMRNRTLSKGEALLMKIGVGVIASTVFVILAVVLISSFESEESFVDPLESFTHVTETELSYLFGYDSVSNTYGDFSYFLNSENEVYQNINTKLQDSETTEVYVLMYRSSSIDTTLLDTINSLEETLFDAAFFVLDVEATANENVFESAALQGLDVEASNETQLITFYIEGKERSDGNTYFFDTVWSDTRNITISLENI